MHYYHLLFTTDSINGTIKNSLAFFFSDLLTENELNFSNYFIELKTLKYLAKVIIMNPTTKSGYEPEVHENITQ